jgi:C_GCAxxG_C_C family probable redox protein
MIKLIAMTKSEKAMDYFQNSFNCAQAVFTPFGQEMGIPEDHCLKIACAFGAGMGRQQCTCGAVTGAMMVLGLHFGKGMGDDNSKKAETYAKTIALFKEFAEKNSSTCCRELLNGLNMNDPEDLKKIEELDLFRIHCEEYVRDAVQITEKLIKG